MKKVLFLVLSMLLLVVSITPVIGSVSMDTPALTNLQAKPQPPAKPFE